MLMTAREPRGIKLGEEVAELVPTAAVPWPPSLPPWVPHPSFPPTLPQGLKGSGATRQLPGLEGSGGPGEESDRPPPAPQRPRMATPSLLKRAMTLANTPGIHTYFLNLMLRLSVNSPSPTR